jgi:hypothetical protein
MTAKPRLSWATRPLPPITAADIERNLDTVARLMGKAGKNADLYLPIWRRLQLELKKRQEADAILAEARSRLTRSRDQTAGQSA